LRWESAAKIGTGSFEMFMNYGNAKNLVNIATGMSYSDKLGAMVDSV